MFEHIFDEEERGQVGIGTLIVFIAMVLVAAIAAGVLINTAGLLQTQAEATGEESTQQVSDRLQVVSISGEVEDPGTTNEISDLSFIMALSPGADPVDLTETSVELIGEDGQETFQIESEGQIGLDGINTNGEDEILTDNNDRIELSLDLQDGGAEFDYAQLNEGERLSVTFTTATGASTTEEIRVPTTITEDDSSVRL